MNSINKITLSLLLFLVGIPAFAAQPAAVQTKPQPVAVQQKPAERVKVTPLEIANNPTKFLNKKVHVEGKFDKFTTLGLDYKKAYKDSAKYIGFLIQRDDVKDHNVPLSELKFFIKRDYAEKFIDLNTGDKISINGTVFSDALTDGWVDVETIQIIEKAKNN